MSRPPRILLFDSGMGGLTVAAAVAQRLPQAELFYCADSAGFPYGAWEEVTLIERILAVVGRAVARTLPDICVIACNTASTIAMNQLREIYPLPFVGTVPAIKPAAEQSRSGIIGVLATPATVKREYTQGLIRAYAAQASVFLHGAPRLAGMAEAKLKGEGVSIAELADEIAPVFRTRGEARTDCVVLGCTHYPLLAEEMKLAAPWEVSWIDPSPAIARRVADVLARESLSGQGPSRAVKAGTVMFTDAAGAANAVAYGPLFGRAEVLDV
jgi:glutamate racemase